MSFEVRLWHIPAESETTRTFSLDIISVYNGPLPTFEPDMFYVLSFSNSDIRKQD